MPEFVSDPRQLALLALRAIQRGAYADEAVDRGVRQGKLDDRDRRLFTELVYGSTRRQRTLDVLIDQLASKPAHHHPPDLRLILHLGLYQLRYLSHIPAAAAVNTTVNLVKQNGLKGLASFANGLLRHYLRLAETTDPLHLPNDSIAHLGIQHSFPDWIVQVYLDQLGAIETAQLCEWLNHPPHLDLRVNRLKVSVADVATALQNQGIPVQFLPHLPQGLRLLASAGAVQDLPGFTQGWWMVQDASAQLVSYLLAPQPGEVVIDACAAPGGKTLHLAELMQDRGVVWACDRTPARLKKLQQNCDRLGVQSIRICSGDSRNQSQFYQQADRVLLDAPCSGLGTLHRHADARWRQTPDSVKALAQLQSELLTQTATWVKPGGTLVYATCSLHPAENEQVIQAFLHHSPDWRLVPPDSENPARAFAEPTGWVKVWNHRHDMDGFFMAQLKKR